MDFGACFKLFNACKKHCAQWDQILSWGPSLTMQYKHIILYFNFFFCFILASFRMGFIAISQFLFDILILQWFSGYLKQIWGKRFQCFANHPLHNIRNKCLYVWIGGWCLACLYTQYMVMYLWGKMCDLLQIFSFAHHRIDELESACLFAFSCWSGSCHYSVLSFFKKQGKNIFATVYASQSGKSKTSFKVAIVQEVSGMFGITC